MQLRTFNISELNIPSTAQHQLSGLQSNANLRGISINNATYPVRI